MNKISSLLLLLLFVQLANAQKLPHLTPMEITEMVPVVLDTQWNLKTSNWSMKPDTFLHFSRCRNANGIVGYLMEAKICLYLSAMGALPPEAECCKAGLQEVQRAETLLATYLDLRADSAQEVQRAFTAPYFYRYIRQYAFYTTPAGDTCVRINCILPYDTMGIDRRYIFISDGDDVFWTSDLNLSQNRPVSFSVNGPMRYYVQGRNNEPQGLYSETLFAKGWKYTGSPCQFSQLPAAVQTALLSQMDTSQISHCLHFSTSYEWFVYEDKNGNEHVKKKRSKSGNYYLIHSDTLCRGYNAKGQLLYVAHEHDFHRIGRECLTHIANVDTMIAAIERDLSARGRDFQQYGHITWAEQVGNHYVLAVSYNSPICAYTLHACYTFDRHGRLEGVYLNQFC